MSILNSFSAASHVETATANSYRRRLEMLVDTVNKFNGIIRLSKANKTLRCKHKVNKYATVHVIVRHSAYFRYSVNEAAERKT